MEHCWTLLDAAIAAIWIIAQYVRLMLFSLNMVSYTMSLLSLSNWNFCNTLSFFEVCYKVIGLKIREWVGVGLQDLIVSPSSFRTNKVFGLGGFRTRGFNLGLDNIGPKPLVPNPPGPKPSSNPKLVQRGPGLTQKSCRPPQPQNLQPWRKPKKIKEWNLLRMLNMGF